MMDSPLNMKDDESGQDAVNAHAAQRAQRFHFSARELDLGSGMIRLHYRLDPGPELTEEFQLPSQALDSWSPHARDKQALDALLDALHWVAGVSYWKCHCPPEILFHGRQPDHWQAAFLQRLYTQGLAEFAHVNNLALDDYLSFQGCDHYAGLPQGGALKPLDLPARALVPIGGGKDSLVVMEQLRHQVPVSLAVVGQAALITQVAQATGLPLLRVHRRIAPELKTLNATGAYNGHIPITAINSIVLSILALMAGYRWLVFANEHSADSATRQHGEGAGVNHQYSKSLAFEQDWRGFLTRYVGGPEYFSLLRPWRELAVCRSFAQMPQYHAVFSSCNRNFHLAGSKLSGDAAQGRWCGACPKCHFVFLALAPFMTRENLIAIFGCNLLDDEKQLDAYAALLGLSAERPFECIGEEAECRAAMMALAQQDEWCSCRIVSTLANRLPATTSSLETLLEPQATHHIPAPFEPKLV